MDILEILKEEDFYSEIHKEIFAVAKSINRNGEKVDMVTVSEELSRRKTLDMVGGRAYVATLTAEVPSTVNAASYARIVKDKSILRHLIRISDDIMDKSYKQKLPSEDIVDYAERNVLDITRDTQKRDYAALKDVLWLNMDQITQLAESEGSITGLSTGFIDLDEKTSGFQKSDLIIVAARPSMGKTALVLNLALNVASKNKARVMIFSLEMSKEQLGQRLLSIDSCVELSKLRAGDLSRSDWEDLNIAIDRLSMADIFIDDTPGISIMEMKNKCRRASSDKPLDMIVVDYLQLMSGEGRSESRQNEISMLSRTLKQLAREIECPVIVLSQLSRAVESRPDHRPQLSDLRESGAIEQDADVVMFLYRDEYYNPDTTEKPNTCEVIIAKQRNGPTGSIDLAWLGKYTKFANKSPLPY